uniref:DUF6599 family protein n=1 Tax=Candidatus Saccharicenans sp. TaxID=2819258 RepID=UPI00404B29A8
MLKADSLILPDTIDGWKLDGPPQKITRENIFDYMDGGGELYLAYKFNQLLVWQYRIAKESEEEILVEVYEMQHPDEAFGLLSLDWTGEPVILNPEIQPLSESGAAPEDTALYGEGLLRARVDNLFLRLLAPRETEEIKAIILKLGKIIAAQSTHLSFPDILKVIGSQPDSGWQIKKDRTSYFHSHLILNSLYYLSHENLLHLAPECEALYAEWTKARAAIKRSTKMIIIKYPDDRKARQALINFMQNYLPEKSGPREEPQVVEPEIAFKLEDGWTGWKLSENFLALIFEAPDEVSVKELISNLTFLNNLH